MKKALICIHHIQITSENIREMRLRCELSRTCEILLPPSVETIRTAWVSCDCGLQGTISQVCHFSGDLNCVLCTCELCL